MSGMVLCQMVNDPLTLTAMLGTREPETNRDTPAICSAINCWIRIDKLVIVNWLYSVLRLCLRIDEKSAILKVKGKNRLKLNEFDWNVLTLCSICSYHQTARSYEKHLQRVLTWRSCWMKRTYFDLKYFEKSHKT